MTLIYHIQCVYIINNILLYLILQHMPIYFGKGYLFSNYYRAEVSMINYLIGYILIVSKILYDIYYVFF